MMIANFMRFVRWKWALPGMAVLVTAGLLLGAATSAQQPAHPAELDPNQATKLAKLMCRQLPNVATILEIVQVQAPDVAHVPVSPQETNCHRRRVRRSSPAGAILSALPDGSLA